jgi:hypothetical protein
MRNACSVLIVGLAMFSLAGCESTGGNAGLGALGEGQLLAGMNDI